MTHGTFTINGARGVKGFEFRRALGYLTLRFTTFVRLIPGSKGTHTASRSLYLS